MKHRFLFLICLLVSLGMEAQVPPLWNTNVHLVGWYRADLGPVVAVDSVERADAWLDQSIYGNHMIAQRSPERRPILRPAAINGLPAMHSTGIFDACMYGALKPINLRQFTIFIVYKEEVRIPGRAILGWRNATLNDARDDSDFNTRDDNEFNKNFYPFTGEQGTNALSFQQMHSDGVLYRAGFSGKGVNTHRYAGRKFSLATFGMSTNLFLRRNAQLFGVSPTPPTIGDCIVDLMHISAHTQPHNPGYPNDLYTNRNRGAGNNQFAEILIYDVALSPSEIDLVEGYLMAKYGFAYGGNLALKGARRSLLNPSQVTVQFSKSPSPASAVVPLNYQIFVAGQIVPVNSVAPGADPRTYLLTASTALGDEGDYDLQVDDVVDHENKAIQQSANTVRIDRGRIDPTEITGRVTVAGFIDDFVGVRLNDSWVARPVRNSLYEVQNGLLRVRTAVGAANHLSYEPLSGYDTVRHEVLARVRILAADGEKFSGGLGVTINETSQGHNWGFGKTGFMQFSTDGAGVESIPFTWRKDTWYWIRLRSEVEGGIQTLEGKVWTADGDTDEPEVWHSWRPPAGSRAGFAGVLAGREGELSEFEIDWILIKAAGLPEVRVEPPTSFLPTLRITHQASRVVVYWPRWANGSLEQSGDPGFGWESATGERNDTEADYVLEAQSTAVPRLFFRLVP